MHNSENNLSGEFFNHKIINKKLGWRKENKCIILRKISLKDLSIIKKKQENLGGERKINAHINAL